jgi:hypothetical protein
MFNKDFKERFLSESPIIESTKKTYRYVLQKAEEMELQIGKDLYEFNPSECDNLINSFPRRSIQSVRMIITVFKTYIDFAIFNGMVESWTDNYFTSISSIEAVEMFLDKSSLEFQYISREKLTELQKMIENPLDVALTELAFVGVNGRKADELLNLKKTDVIAEYENKGGYTVFKNAYINLPDRKIEIEENTYNIIVDAIEQKEYVKSNGNTDAYMKCTTMQLAESDYIIRNAGATRDNVSYASLQMKFNRIKEYIGNSYLNLSYFWQSGMLHQLKKMKEESGELVDNDFKKVHERFGYATPITQTKIRFRNLL